MPPLDWHLAPKVLFSKLSFSITVLTYSLEYHKRKSLSTSKAMTGACGPGLLKVPCEAMRSQCLMNQGRSKRPSDIRLSHGKNLNIVLALCSVLPVLQCPGC